MSLTIPAIKKHYRIDRHVIINHGDRDGWRTFEILPGDQEWFLNGEKLTSDIIEATLPYIAKEVEAGNATWEYQLYEKTEFGIIKVG